MDMSFFNTHYKYTLLYKILRIYNHDVDTFYSLKYTY